MLYLSIQTCYTYLSFYNSQSVQVRNNFEELDCAAHAWLSAIHFIPVGIATASGLAALTTLTHLLRAGDHVVVCDDVYGGIQ